MLIRAGCPKALAMLARLSCNSVYVSGLVAPNSLSLDLSQYYDIMLCLEWFFNSFLNHYRVSAVAYVKSYFNKWPVNQCYS